MLLTVGLSLIRGEVYFALTSLHQSLAKVVRHRHAILGPELTPEYFVEVGRERIAWATGHLIIREAARASAVASRVTNKVESYK